MSIIRAIIAWIISLLSKKKDTYIKIKGRAFMPLFYPAIDATKTAGTWNYLSQSIAEQDHTRNTIKSLAVKGETPAITFLLAPSHEAGNIWSKFPEINQDNLNKAIVAIEKCIDDGIAVFPCLYNDDTEPWWYKIEDVQAAWTEINNQIGKYVTGYILSIESNEKASNVSTLQHMIYIMQQAMPGKEYYGTHLQYKGKGLRWSSVQSTPANANLILVEFSWHPASGNNAGLSAVKQEYAEIIKFCSDKHLIWHEYNMKPGSTMDEQRKWLREQKPWGVG